MDKLQINTRVDGQSLGVGRRRNWNEISESALNLSVKFWFLVTALGQWIFVLYVAAFYGPLLLGKGLEGLNETHLPNGYIAGDTAGNLAIAAHLMLALIIIGGGPLQLIPHIRERFPVFHRWNGRAYLLTAVVSSIAGLYMIWTRGTIGGVILQYGITLDGILILVFAFMTLRYAMARKIAFHRRWALRLFVVTSGVWFYRIGLMGWVITTGGAGIDFDSFSGPFLTVWAFAQYLFPLLVLECYLRTRDRAGTRGRLVMASSLMVLTGLMALGIFAATMGMWLPRV